ncbi:MAG: site-specific integrase [Methylococcales bacterium]|nr:site-specific integrase [Methylococcales bacterium]
MSKRKSEGLFKRGDSQFWWIDYIDGCGKRTRKSTQTADRKEAEVLLAKYKLESHLERVWGKPAQKTQIDYSFDETLLLYIKEKSVGRRTKSTAKNLYGYFTGKLMSQIGDLEVKAYIRSRLKEGVVAGTINKEIGLLSAAINFANTDYGWELKNPVTGKKLQEPEGVVRWITPEEANKLINAASGITKAPWLVDFIRLALNTGCRAGELLGLEWARVDLEKEFFILEAEHQKNRRRNSVPLNAEAIVALMARAEFRKTHCPDSPWVFCSKDGNQLQSLKKSWATACKLAGIENFRIHDQRHTFASWLVMENVPLYTVSKVLRHSTVKMTEKYAHLNPENLRDAVRVLDTLSRFGHGAPHTGTSQQPNPLI